MVSLKSEGVKVVLGLGGWDDSASDKYSKLVNSANARRKFIVHAVDFIEQYEFDGLDLDWEYPKCWQVNISTTSISFTISNNTIHRSMLSKLYIYLIDQTTSPQKVNFENEVGLQLTR